jgi:MoxR-like ATPase
MPSFDEMERAQLTDAATRSFDATKLQDLRTEVRAEIAKVVIGYEDTVDLLLVAAVAGGHVLLEGPPGVAKTLLAGSLAQVLGVQYKRIQFTPDTTPSHIVGTMSKKMGEPVFVPGPVFTNLLLADEINRTQSRTQAALLEAMQERHVTVEGRTHWLPTPFIVIATQNPYEQMGIFPLPESQLDRFLFKITLDYGSPEDELNILRQPHRGLAPDLLGEVTPLLDVVRLDAAQRELDRTAVPDDAATFVVAVARKTREHPQVTLGASPRAAVHLLSAAKARARLDGRDSVVREDVEAVAPAVLAHRLMLKSGNAHEVVAEAVAAARAG